ncbi:MAG: hypothetical protein IJ242_10020 [Clostridia bacterium]|nr:hypothetical protein [Clostridia bacterium]
MLEPNPFPEQPVEPAPEYEPSPYERMAHEMEEKRQAQACDNVTASPWWSYQSYLNYGSRNLWVRGTDGEKIFHKSQAVFDGDHKNLILTVMCDNLDGVNMRFDSTVLDYLERYDITKIIMVSDNGDAGMQYQVADMKAAREKFGLEADELLMIGGPDDTIMKGMDANGEFVPVEEKQE